ncbi:MAG TPA: hypothetical protein VEF34_14140 [Syntrophobacteraceae bacterium]|nr:hypothetical protein [Syntrophobacteraceae bacterium]
MKKIGFGLFLVFVAALLAAQSLHAQNFAPGGYKLKIVVGGPVSCTHGTTLNLGVVVINENSFDVTCASLMALVVDPWTGAAIVGPKPTAVNQKLAPYSESTLVTVSLNIPSTVQSNTTLAVVIFAVENSEEKGLQFIAGTAAWGFVAK